MNFNLALLVIVVFLCPNIGDAADALTDAEVKERVDQFLGIIDRPVSSSQWNALGNRAVPILEAIIHDDAVLPSRRATAVWALVLLSPTDATPHLTRLAQDDQAPLVVRHAAIRCFGRAAPQLLRVPTLKDWLSDKNVQVRSVVLEVLARQDSAEACKMVREHLSVETEHPHMFSQARANCEARPGPHPNSIRE